MTSIFPATCIHGVAWSQPCAACGRGYYPPSPPPPPATWDRTGDILDRLDRIIVVMERIAVALEKQP